MFELRGKKKRNKNGDFEFDSNYVIRNKKRTCTFPSIYELK